MTQRMMVGLTRPKENIDAGRGAQRYAASTSHRAWASTCLVDAAKQEFFGHAGAVLAERDQVGAELFFLLEHAK